MLRLFLFSILFLLSPVTLSISYGWPISVQQSAKSEKQLQQLYEKAFELHKSGDHAAAIAQFNELLQSSNLPVKIEINSRYYLGRSYSLSQQYEKALAVFQLIKIGQWAGLLAHYEMGKVYVEQKDFALAASAYEWLKNESLSAEKFDLSFADPFSSRDKKAHSPEERKQSYRALANDLKTYLADTFTPEEAAQHKVSQAPYPLPNAPPKIETRTSLDNLSRPQIVYKEKAQHTEVARINLVKGTVILNVVFTADGLIQRIRVVRGLPDGLNRNSILAALKIRFNPAIKDGAPVSMRGNLEYVLDSY